MEEAAIIRVEIPAEEDEKDVKEGLGINHKEEKQRWHR